MADASNSVFISYRRSTSSFIARAVFMDLRANGYDVFLDVETIDSGAFDTIILNQIAARPHFVLVLTPGALERCNEPGDWLRREIEEAIRLKRNIVPILVNEFSFAGNESFMNGALSVLPRYNAVKLFHEYFDEALDRLRKRYLKPPEHAVELASIPSTEEAIVERKIEEIASQPIPTRDHLLAEELLWRGHMLHPPNDYDSRIADYSEAIRLNPEFAEAYKSRGNMHVRKNELRKALADYDAALHLNARYAEAYYNRGGVRYELSDYEGALQDYADAVRFMPHNAEEYDESLRYARKQYAVALNNRAETYFLEGRFDEALDDLRKANDVMPAYNIVLAGLAVTHYAVGQTWEARRIWKFLVDYDVRYTDAMWVGDIWSWPTELTDMAHKIIASL
ncbi:MAG: tetratricopeptide repeat protein [Anaerolineae bacterium]